MVRTYLVNLFQVQKWQNLHYFTIEAKKANEMQKF